MPQTLIQIFLETVDRLHKPAQFTRRAANGWETISAEQAHADVERLALGLRAAGVERGDRVAILSENRYEWAVSDLAIVGQGAVSVPIYPTLTASQACYILANAEAKVAIVSSAAQLEKLRSTRGQLPHLKLIVVLDPPSGLHADEVAFATILEQGAERRRAEPTAFHTLAASVRPDDLATIIYTSGTTGDPKGAMLTHGNIASNVEAALGVVELRADDTCLSFLPLCHIFERMAGMYAMLAGGVTIAYARSIDTVAEDAVAVKPTVMTGVPRFFEKVHARVLENVAKYPPLRRRIFHWGLAQGRIKARAHFQGRHVNTLAMRLADRLVAHKVRERVGGRLRLMISGGAPLAPDTMEFFFAMGLPVVEGYGLTETSPVICLNPPGHERPGSVGRPLPGVEVRIGDEGEILTRGPHVMLGYFRNDEATRQAIRDGWFHTGDVGRIDTDGYLHITDRLKDLLVLAGGKKVAPQPIEARLKASPWIAEAVLLGDRRPYVVAMIVPHLPHLETEARSRGWSFANPAELARHPEVVALLQREVDAVNATLAPFETIKRFSVLDRELTVEAGELTPTLKVKRRVITTRFAEAIESLYAGHARPAAA